MNLALLSTAEPFTAHVGRATLDRLIENLSGFFYRRRNDPQWTMDFVSARCRDLTGYDPHRLIANASLTYADLIAQSDRERANARVQFAIRHGERASMEYRIRAAHGGWLHVEDRFAPVMDTAGNVVAIEGVVDRAPHSSATPWIAG